MCCIKEEMVKLIFETKINRFPLCCFFSCEFEEPAVFICVITLRAVTERNFKDSHFCHLPMYEVATEKFYLNVKKYTYLIYLHYKVVVLHKDSDKLDHQNANKVNISSRLN